jgi:hypothetical protein
MKGCLIPTDSRSQFPKVNIIFDNTGCPLHAEFMEGYFGVTDRVMWSEIIFKL